jgi:glyoxylase-like metal-dependent hydrolase (beta-lactamase superfamily II)
MRVHHLNCISSCPLGGRLMDGRSHCLLCRGGLTCHCLLIETDSGLVLVDTGFGTRDVADPGSRLSKFFLALLSPDFRLEMTAVKQIESLGFKASDVRHIVMTHLDFDHAGGLDDFPQATVHLLEAEQQYALLQKTWMDRQRFRPQQWSSQNRWRSYQATGESWFGFDAVQRIDGLPPEILMIPLRGHTFGHCGVAVQHSGVWKLLAGDAYFYHREMDLVDPYCTPGLRMYQWMLEKDRKARLTNQQRLRTLVAKESEVRVFCSHDVLEFERITGRPAGLPVPGRL